MSSYEDESYIIIDEQHNGSPVSNRRNLSPSNESRRDRMRSRSRSYEDRRHSNGNNNNHRSRSPRNRSRSRNRDNSRDRSHRRTEANRSSRSTTQQDRELGLKYRWEKTVYVSNIPWDVRWPDLKDLFRNKVGDIMYCEVFEKENRSLGVGAIEFKTVDDAERAVSLMHQYELNGRKISCRIDNEGYKTRQAKEMSLENTNGHNSSSSKHSNNGNSNGNNLDSSSALALALNQATSLLTNTLPASNPSSSLLSLLGIAANPLVSAQTPSPINNSLMGTFGGSNPSAAQTTLLNQFAAALKVDGPVTNRIFVASLDYKVDEKKIKEVYSLAGVVQSVSLFRDRENKSRGMAVVEYDTPFEALNAVSMFNNQQLLDRQMTVRFDTKPPREDEQNNKSSSQSQTKLPSGLKSIGSGIGINNLLGSISNTTSQNNLALNALSALTGLNNQSTDLSALTGLGISLNGTAPSLMGSLLGSGIGNSNSLLGNMNGSSSNLQHGRAISKIFVKNIPFSWDDRRLKEKFRQAGQIEYAEIKQKDGKSRGCGLIRFSTPEQANKAVELFNGSRFEGRTLEVKLDQL